jgi:hypothetical protein
MASCSKENAATTNPEVENTFEIGKSQALADNLTEDAHDIFTEAAADKNLMGFANGNQPLRTPNALAFATISVTPAAGFPKTINIDFGTNGITRRGKITVLLTDSVRRAGSKATMNFINYSVNGFKKEGIITWTNTSTAITRSWQRKVEHGKITAPDGKYWFHNGNKQLIQLTGWNTPINLLDDLFLITGNHSITNAAGKSRTCTVTEGLQKQTGCDNIGTGKLKVEGPNHFAIIDFGNGSCDKIATISIDGNEPRTIALR